MAVVEFALKVKNNSQEKAADELLSAIDEVLVAMDRISDDKWEAVFEAGWKKGNHYFNRIVFHPKEESEWKKSDEED